MLSLYGILSGVPLDPQVEAERLSRALKRVPPEEEKPIYIN